MSEFVVHFNDKGDNEQEKYEETLRKPMLSLDDKDVKESLKKNEENLTLRFNTCHILLNDIEHVEKNATNPWKNILSSSQVK